MLKICRKNETNSTKRLTNCKYCDTLIPSIIMANVIKFVNWKRLGHYCSIERIGEQK